jgi:ATP phosphoribosyltransferase
MGMNDEVRPGMPVQVTITGYSETREVVRVGDTLALGATTSKIILAFPQTNKDVSPKTFIIEVPGEVVEEYAECTYDLFREAHPEQNLPARVPGTCPPIIMIDKAH